MGWNDMTREQMEAQLLRQAQLIGEMREALRPFAEAVRVEGTRYVTSTKVPKFGPLTLIKARRVYDRNQ